MDILNQLEVKATFFVSGWRLLDPEYENCMVYAHMHGHLIAVHGFTHMNMVDALSLNESIKEIKDTADLILGDTGVSPFLFRPPFGEMSAELGNEVYSMGYDICLWNLDPRDWESSTLDIIQSAQQVS